jgi:hypothetical protein
MTPHSMSTPPGATRLLWGGDVSSRLRWVDVPVAVNPGDRLFFSTTNKWRDASNVCDANGYDKPYLEWVKGLLRHQAPDATWFTLICALDHNPDSQFAVGDGSRWGDGWVSPGAGQLSCFANDAWLFYWNNCGSVFLQVWA